MANQLWDRLVDPRTLKAGWHLTRAEMKKDFAERLLVDDAFALDLDNKINELSRKLRTETYEAKPLIRIDVPKSNLAVRPGTVIHIEDRVVLFAALKLIAPNIDQTISECVYSYRVKKGAIKTALFKESDIVDLPYLKSKTIRKRIEPFEPWYEAWPEFDEESRSAFENDGYRYLVTSDISAYFENLQLSLLRDMLLQHLPADQKIVNLIYRSLVSWVVKSSDGHPPPRGIPQGSAISSFLGNIYLAPVDEELIRFCAEVNGRYFRHMDDIRVFTRDIASARKAVFRLDYIIRRLHLNVQSAKTRIRDESLREISFELMDDRLKELGEIDEEIDIALKARKLDPKTKRELLARLKSVADTVPRSPNEQKLTGARKSMKGLSLRVFRRWMTCHSRLKSTAYARPLLKQIRLTPDYRLTRKLETLIRQSPRSKTIVGDLMEFLGSDLNIFSHQHAEIIRSLRYADVIPKALRACPITC